MILKAISLFLSSIFQIAFIFFPNGDKEIYRHDSNNLQIKYILQNLLTL